MANVVENVKNQKNYNKNVINVYFLLMRRTRYLHISSFIGGVEVERNSQFMIITP